MIYNYLFHLYIYKLLLVIYKYFICIFIKFFWLYRILYFICIFINFFWRYMNIYFICILINFSLQTHMSKWFQYFCSQANIYGRCCQLSVRPPITMKSHYACSCEYHHTKCQAAVIIVIAYVGGWNYLTTYITVFY